MPHIYSNRSKPATAVLVLLLASLALVACGGSSTSSTSSSSTNASASTSATTSTTGAPAGARAGRLTALRECLQKNGVTLPKPTPGQRRTPGGGFLGGGAGTALPKGVTRAQYEAALKKCGGGTGFAGRGNPAFKAALAKFAACMRENGVKLPEPNTSGKGPIFNTKGVNTASAQFKAADTKCARDLRASFRATPGRAAGAPPAAG
jgi:hypothetical protein